MWWLLVMLWCLKPLSLSLSLSVYVCGVCLCVISGFIYQYDIATFIYIYICICICDVMFILFLIVCIFVYLGTNDQVNQIAQNNKTHMASPDPEPQNAGIKYVYLSIYLALCVYVLYVLRVSLSYNLL